MHSGSGVQHKDSGPLKILNVYTYENKGNGQHREIVVLQKYHVVEYNGQCDGVVSRAPEGSFLEICLKWHKICQDVKKT